jgi:histidine ammonia-lyase
MGTIAIRQCREILNNVEHVIAIEMLCAAQAYDLLTENNPLKAGKGTREAYKIIREKIPYLDKDRVLSKDIDAMVSLLRSEAIVKGVEEAVGELK